MFIGFFLSFYYDALSKLIYLSQSAHIYVLLCMVMSQDAGIRVGFGFWSRVRQGSGFLSRVIHRIKARIILEGKCDLIQVPRPFKFAINSVINNYKIAKLAYIQNNASLISI